MHDSAETPAWHHLPATARAAYVVRECREGRWLPLCRQPLDEHVLAVMSAVEAAQQNRMDDFVSVLAGHDKDALIATLVKILGEVLQDQDLNLDFVRVWSSYAVVRSST